ncbi:MAG: polyprenol monophosphomannose synthase [Candidatus Omnitrophota bacterium]
MSKALVIIPTYNERENIDKIVSKVLSLGRGMDVLIVDDSSPDGTGEEADRLAAEQQAVKVIHRPSKMGMGRAYVDGFKWALENDYDYLFEMDADFSHNPEDLTRLLDEMDTCDVCIGSRYVKGAGVVNWPLWREILSRSANIYVKLVTGMPVIDGTAGFKCYKRKVLEGIDLDKVRSEGYSFQIEMHYKAWKRGFNIKEVPITFTERREGQSKMSKSIVFEAFFAVWRLKLGL